MTHTVWSNPAKTLDRVTGLRMQSCVDAHRMKWFAKGGVKMSEQAYKTMKSVGIFNLIFGILTIAAGIGAGVCMIIAGAKLLQKKSNILF